MRKTEEWGDEQVERDASAAVAEARTKGVDVETRGVFYFIKRSGKRIAVAIGGTVLILAGIAMLALPGPGWLTIFAGLALLATEFVWAERLLKKAKTKAVQAKEAAFGKKDARAAKKAAKRAAKEVRDAGTPLEGNSSSSPQDGSTDQPSTGSPS